MSEYLRAGKSGRQEKMWGSHPSLLSGELSVYVKP